MSEAAQKSFSNRLPSKEERNSADQLRRILASVLEDDQPAALKVCDEQCEVTNVILAPALGHLLMELLRHISAGHAVTLVPIHSQLSTQQAADLLNVSRPHLIKLLDEGKISYTKVGRHRRVLAEDVLAYKRERDRSRADYLSDLARSDAERDLL